MNVNCPGCKASYFVSEEKIPEKGGRLTCPSCGKRWEIFRQGTDETSSVSDAAPGGKATAAAPAGAATSPIKRRGELEIPAAEPPVACPKCGHSFVPQRRPSTSVSPPASSGRRMVLLVEDQNYFSELTREALGQEYRTVSVATKDEALKVIASDPPSIMILDLSLARNQDGRDLLRAMPKKTFPILIFTAKDETELYGEVWEELKRLGADDVVLKGMNVADELRRKVASLLRVD